MSRSTNSRKGRRNGAVSRLLCSCHCGDCDVKVTRGKHARPLTRQHRADYAELRWVS